MLFQRFLQLIKIIWSSDEKLISHKEFINTFKKYFRELYLYGCNDYIIVINKP